MSHGARVGVAEVAHAVSVTPIPPCPDVCRRVEAEFREMPGLRLTLPQASRLFGLPTPACAAVLRHLVEHGLLRVTVQGLYASSPSPSS